MSDPIAQKDKDLVSRLIKVMLLIGAVALSYVILQSCSTPKTGIERFAKGGLSRLVSLETPPVIPSASFNDVGGEPTSLQNLRGDWMLVNIWATWCAPCIAELPSLNQLAADYPDIKVVAISVDRQAADAQDFLNQIGADNLALYHDNTFAIAGKGALAAYGIPLTVIYTPSGAEVSRIQGEADWQSDEAERYLRYLGLEKR